MAVSEINRIEKKLLIRAPRERVWRAITNIEEFSKWFQVEAEGRFEPGARLRMTSTHENCKGAVFYVNIQEMIEGRLFSWRWHPGQARPDVDYSKEPTTEVVFRLEDAEGGTLVTVTESGFDRISLVRRAGTYAENVEGWRIQMASLERYVASAA